MRRPCSSRLHPLWNIESIKGLLLSKKKLKPSHFWVGVWKFWGPEGMLEPSFLISEGNGPGAGQCLALGHTVITHQPFLLPEGRFWKPEAYVPFPQSLWTPVRGCARTGKDTPQGSGAASTDTLLPDNRGPRTQCPAQGSDAGQPLKDRKAEDGYRQWPQAIARRNPQTRLTPAPVPAIAGTVGWLTVSRKQDTKLRVGSSISQIVSIFSFAGWKVSVSVTQFCCFRRKMGRACSKKSHMCKNGQRARFGVQAIVSHVLH